MNSVQAFESTSLKNLTKNRLLTKEDLFAKVESLSFTRKDLVGEGVFFRVLSDEALQYSLSCWSFGKGSVIYRAAVSLIIPLDRRVSHGVYFDDGTGVTLRNLYRSALERE
ncbi:MAG: hypothetical protein Q8R18_06380 [bacterium]|nr:hypothetical protein [bacterium]